MSGIRGCKGQRRECVIGFNVRHYLSQGQFCVLRITVEIRHNVCLLYCEFGELISCTWYKPGVVMRVLYSVHNTVLGSVVHTAHGWVAD